MEQSPSWEANWSAASQEIPRIRQATDIKKIDGITRKHFRTQATEETKLGIHSTTVKAALKFGIEAWVLKKKDDKKMEPSRMKLRRHLRGITELGRERNQSFRDKLVV